MTDPTEYRTLPAALRLAASDIADTDLARGRQTLRDKFEAMGLFYPEVSESDPYAKLNKEGFDHWSKRELAVIRIHSAMMKGEIEIDVRDPVSGAILGLSQGFGWAQRLLKILFEAVSSERLPARVSCHTAAGFL